MARRNSDSSLRSAARQHHWRATAIFSSVSPPTAGPTTPAGYSPRKGSIAVRTTVCFCGIFSAKDIPSSRVQWLLRGSPVGLTQSPVFLGLLIPTADASLGRAAQAWGPAMTTWAFSGHTCCLQRLFVASSSAPGAACWLLFSGSTLVCERAGPITLHRFSDPQGTVSAFPATRRDGFFKDATEVVQLAPAAHRTGQARPGPATRRRPRMHGSTRALSTR